jgi:protein O-mannosyl-transferase
VKHKKIYIGSWPYILVGILVVLVYFPTFSGNFILDDNSLIKYNSYIKTFHTPTSYFIQEEGIADEYNKGGYHTGYYRPLINLIYSIEYKLWGLSAPGFRTTNLLLHLFCCFLLFYFLQFLIKDRDASLWATLFFALQPVNTEAVSWIGPRDNILVAIFSIAALFCYIKGREGGSRWVQVTSILMFVLAILSKEMGLMVIPLLFLYHRLLSQAKRNIREELLSYLPFIIVAACYFFLRKIVTSSFSSPLQIVDFWRSVYFAPYLILWNLRLIFLPYDLHSFVVDYPSSYLTWQALAGFFYIALLVLLVCRLRKNRLMIFSVLSFHVLIFPVLNIVPTPAISLVAIRWVYFPMAFLTIVFAQLLMGVLGTHGFVTRGVLCAILVYFGSYSYMLNANLWKNESNFFRQEVMHFGNHYYAGGLAENLLERKQYKSSEEYFQIAIKNYPRNAINYLNYSALLIDTGRFDAAIACLKKAEGFSMTAKRRGQWCNNMGVAYFYLENYDEALKYLIRAVNHWPQEIENRINLGGVYAVKGDYGNALSVLKKGLEIEPDSVSLLKNLAIIYIQMENYKEAGTVLEEIPKREWGKNGIQEILQRVQKGFGD